MRKNLTALFVNSVEPPELGQVDYWDAKLRGFGLRVSQGGRKVWVAMYRHQGRQRRYTIGTFPTLTLADAREEARKALARVQTGTDVAEVKQTSRRGDTFGELVARYMAEHAAVKNKPGTLREKKKLAEVLTQWENRKAADITRREVVAVVDAIAARGARIRANRLVAFLSSVFTFGVAKEIVLANPAFRIPKPGLETQRDRVLTDAEIKAVWEALDGESARIAAIFKLALLTAQRRGEICGMQWSELDLDAGWWAIPAERTKNRLPHRVPLGAHAVAMLRALRGPADKTATTPFVFQSARRPGQPLLNIQKPLRRLEKAARTSFRVHDLRRSAATGMAQMGVPRLTISQILNHREGGVTQIYDRYSYDREKRIALVKWDERLREIVTGASSAKVVELDQYRTGEHR
jgi:integrase